MQRDEEEIRIGDRVQTYVMVCDERIAMATGRVVGKSGDGRTCDVDMSRPGCTPRITVEATNNLKKL